MSQLIYSTTFLADFFPIYFQGCKGDSPVASGVKTLAFASLAPAAIITGLSVNATGRYRVQMWISWTIIIVALGLMSTLHATDALGKSIGYLLFLGFGIGYVMFTDKLGSLSDVLVRIAV